MVHDPAESASPPSEAGAVTLPAEAFAAAGGRRCRNCDAPMLGQTCYACGQPEKGLVRHFTSIIGDLLDTVLNVDERILRTLWPLLAKPGYLSNEYFAGRRVRYVSPVRLFAFLCIALFFVLQFVADDRIVGGTGDIEHAPTIAEVEQQRDRAIADLQRSREAQQDPYARIGIDGAIVGVREAAQRRIAQLSARAEAQQRGELTPEIRFEPGSSLQFNGHPWHPVDNPIVVDWLPASGNAWLNRLAARLQHGLERARQQPQLVVDTSLQTLPQTFFVLLPLFALLLKLLYLLQRRLYMEHLIVALHSHAFLCLALLAILGLSALGTLAGSDGLLDRALGWAELGLALWMPVYLWLMQKRVYRQGVVLTSLKFALGGFAYLLLLALGVVVNLAFNLVSL